MKYGKDHGNYKHGMLGAREYVTWTAMLQRCLYKKSKSYIYYGGRGITVCRRWRKFENFFRDMGLKPKGLTLDRTDNNKGYLKSNCRWATRTEQSINRRMQKNNTSGVVGIFWGVREQRYIVRPTVLGKPIYLGCFKTIREATRALGRRETNKICRIKKHLKRCGEDGIALKCLKKTDINITLEQFEITFDLWIQDYRITAWEGLDSDEILCLCKFHRENFLKELREHKKK